MDQEATVEQQQPEEPEEEECEETEAIAMEGDPEEDSGDAVPETETQAMEVQEAEENTQEEEAEENTQEEEAEENTQEEEAEENMQEEEAEENMQEEEEVGEPEASEEAAVAEEEKAHNDSTATVERQKAAPKDKVLWRLRVCPIQFEDFCRLRKDFQTIIKLSTSFEYRMSQHLCTKIEAGAWTHKVEVEDKDFPWLPNEKTYTKPQNAATAGMVEIHVRPRDLVDMMTLIRTADLSKRNRLRFELKRLCRKKEVKTEGETQTEEKETTEVKEAEEGEENPEDKKTSDMTVNFAVRLKPVKVAAFSHPQGYDLKAEDKQIFISKVPEDVPDDVLKAVVLSKLLDRQEAEDGSITAVFEVSSPLGAQGYMELFDGILLNRKELEMATTLGTLYESKKKHSEREQQNRQVNEQQVKAMKRKPSGPPTGPQEAKKPRSEKLDPIAQIWMKGQDVFRGAHGTLMRGNMATQRLRAVERASLRARGTSRGAAAAGRGQTRAGLAGRGLRGTLQRARGVGSPGRGVLGRAPPLRGSGALLRRPGQALTPGGRGAALRGATRSRVFVRGAVRGVAPRGGRGPPRVRGAAGGVSPSLRGGQGQGYGGLEDLQAKLLATERHLEMLQESARMADYDAFNRGPSFRDDRFGPRGGYDRGGDYYDEGYDDYFQQGFYSHRRRW